MQFVLDNAPQNMERRTKTVIRLVKDCQIHYATFRMSSAWSMWRL